MPEVRKIFEEQHIQPREGQLEVAETLANFLVEGKRTLLTAPTGWGKSLVALIALKAAGTLPAVWLTRSLALAEHIAEMAAPLFFTYVAGGREKTCLLWESLKDAAYDLCRYARHKCPFARLPPPRALAVTDWKEMVKAARAGGWCPYFAQDAVPSDLTIQNYERAIRRPYMAFIIDECHNLAFPEEKVITIARLAESIAYARHYVSARVHARLGALMRYTLIKDGTLDPHLFLGEEEVEELKRVYIQLLTEEPERAAELRPLLTVALATAAYIEAEKVSIFRPKRVMHVRPAILLTATPLPLPIQLDAEINVEWKTRARAVIITDVTTKFDEFTTSMVARYKRLLIMLAKKFKRILAVAASERVARELRSWVQFEEVIPPPDWEGVLMIKARSRFAEGIDLPANAITLLGAPYLPPEVSDRLARIYKAQGIENSVRLAVDGPMIAVTVQSIGRAWRNPARPPLVVLADARFSRYKEELQKMLDIEEEVASDELNKALQRATSPNTA
jgi:DNA excision repair protein ERCC-2